MLVVDDGLQFVVVTFTHILKSAQQGVYSLLSAANWIGIISREEGKSLMLITTIKITDIIPFALILHEFTI